MATLPELARLRTRLSASDIEHLQRLVGSWDLLSDLCFADLMLFAAASEPSRAGALVVLGQVRPTTGQTLYRSDWVGDVIDPGDRPLVARCLELGEIIEGEVTSEALREAVREQCIPVRHRGETIGVLAREAATSIGRHPGELERTYVEVFSRFARMIASGEFPFARDEVLVEESPRVGDGAIVLDGSMRVSYTSPNAVSALHRMGIHANSEGRRLGELGLHEGSVRGAFTKRRPATEELELGSEVTVLLRCIPLLEHGEVIGALVLLRDISELRRRDRLLISKDATIREIHHRVKNNLQTISSLLRLQGRRLSSPEAKAAVEESVRRIRSIALVHETLSHAAGDDVRFVEIVRPLVRMVEEGLISPEHPVQFKVVGDAGRLPAAVATSLAVVLTEALQNVVDHAYGGEPDEPGHVVIELANDGRELRVAVTDDGAGLPPGFTVEAATGLGLSIVRTLVTTELGGTIEVRRGDGPPDRPGTVVDIRVPVSGVGAPEAYAASLDTGQVPVVSIHPDGHPDAQRPPGQGGR